MKLVVDIYLDETKKVTFISINLNFQWSTNETGLLGVLLFVVFFEREVIFFSLCKIVIYEKVVITFITLLSLNDIT